MSFPALDPRPLARNGVLSLVLLAGAAPAPPAFAVHLPNGFGLEPVIVGIFEPGRPVAFAPLPDGRFLIIERNTARVRLHLPGETSAPIIHTVPNVGTLTERGLLGVAIDPDWPTRPYVYLYYTHTSLTSRVTMFTVVGDLEDPRSANLQLTLPYDLIADIPDLHDIHNGGTLRFGTDGMLYLSIGDDGDACNAQILASLRGAILRLDVSAMPGVGPGPPPKADITPPDNPFSGPGENERLVWVWGLRNPFRFTIDPATNDLFIGDVGWVSYEEVNHVPFSGGGGQNYGWPHFEGPVDPGLGLSCGEDNTFTDPIYAYPHGPIASVVVGPRYRAGSGPFAFPPEYEGAVLVIEIWQYWARWLVETESGWEVMAPVSGQPGANWADSLLYVVDAQQGVDGAVYVMQLVPVAGASSGLYRIVPLEPTSAGAPLAEAGRSRAVPNPASARSGTRITWRPEHTGPHVIRIMDSAGRMVRLLRTSASRPESADVWWNA